MAKRDLLASNLTGALINHRQPDKKALLRLNGRVTAAPHDVATLTQHGEVFNPRWKQVEKPRLFY